LQRHLCGRLAGAHLVPLSSSSSRLDGIPPVSLPPPRYTAPAKPKGVACATSSARSSRCWSSCSQRPPRVEPPPPPRRSSPPSPPPTATTPRGSSPPRTTN